MKKLILIIAILHLLTSALFSMRFYYKKNKALTYFEETILDQKIYRDKKLFLKTKIKSILKVKQYKISGDARYFKGTIEYHIPDGDGEFSKKTQRNISFSRNKLGSIILKKGSKFFPRRNFPKFLNKNIRINKSWSAPVYERFNLTPLGIRKEIEVSAKVTYRYIRDQELDGYHVAVIFYFYSFNKKIKNKQQTTVKGTVIGLLFWNKENQSPYRFSESFNISFKTDDSRSLRSDGYAEKSVYIITTKEKKKFKLRKAIQKSLDKNQNLRISKKGVVLNLKNILFDTDKSVIKKEYIIKLKKVSDFLKKRKDLRIRIEGHTDNLGELKYNTDLSYRRATAVYNYFTKIKKIPSSRITYRGWGPLKPIASNLSKKGRKKNRRVEIIFLLK